MERTLIKQGGGGFTVYLPKKWVDKRALVPGQKVQIVEQENGLFIEAKSAQKKSITINLTPTEKQNILHLLTHLYRRGFDLITLTNLDTKTTTETRRVVHQVLLGFEITEQTTATCTIENLSEPTSDRYESMFSRAFLIIKETLKLIRDDLASGSYDNSASIEDLRIQQDRIAIFCKRLLIKGAVNEDPVTQWELLSFLIHIEHEIRFLYVGAKDAQLKLRKEELEVIDDLYSYFITFSDAYSKRTLERAHTVFVTRFKHYELCESMIERTKGSQSIVFSHARTALRLISLAGSSVLSICLEEALSEGAQ